MYIQIVSGGDEKRWLCSPTYNCGRHFRSCDHWRQMKFKIDKSLTRSTQLNRDRSLTSNILGRIGSPTRAKASAGENGTTASYCVIPRECVGMSLTNFSHYISRMTRVAWDIAQVAATPHALQNSSISTRQWHIHSMFDYKSFSINCYTYTFVKNPWDWYDSAVCFCCQQHVLQNNSTAH